MMFGINKNQSFFAASITAAIFSCALTGCSKFGGFNVGNLSPSAVLDIGENAYKAATLTDADVQKLAHQAVTEMDQSGSVAPSSSPYAKRLAKLTARHAKNDGTKFNYKVYLNPEVNAFSTADGSVRVYSGLMDKMDDDELLFVIGHEIGHVKNGHRKARLERAYAAAAAAGAIGQGLSAATSNDIGGIGITVGGAMLADLAADVLKGQFSQGDETQSDEFGLHLVHNDKRPAEASVTALLKLKGDDEGSTPSTLEQFTSSHPDPEARAEHIKLLIPSLGTVVARNSSRSSPPPSTFNKESAGTNSDSSIASSDIAAVKDSLPDNNKSSAEDGGIQAVAHLPEVAIERENSAGEKSVTETARAGSWFIQVGAFREESHAASLQTSASSNRASAQIKSCGSGNNAMYRVLVGPFASRDEAAIEASELKQTGAASSDAFVRTFSSC